jgi:hypothetical protein
MNTIRQIQDSSSSEDDSMLISGKGSSSSSFSSTAMGKVLRGFDSVEGGGALACDWRAKVDFGGAVEEWSEGWRGFTIVEGWFAEVDVSPTPNDEDVDSGNGRG